jgi:porphobilinogen synthase
MTIMQSLKIKNDETSIDQENLVIPKRPRRNRKSPAIRALVQETRIHASNFVSPLFVMEGVNQKSAIASMPEIYRLSIDLLIKEVIHLYELGIRAVDLFPVVSNDLKNPLGSEAINPNSLIFRAIHTIKKEVPEMCVMADVALDPFTDHGHDGVIDSNGRILNDETVKILAKFSILAAEAGADVVAPSDMMDGRVAYIRKALDQQGFTDISILSYAAKYASGFYGPFREALNSAPKFGDKKTYQMNPANAREAILEVFLDESEGADMLLIKPALAYLDIIAKIKEQTLLPLGAYHVSGEYAMVMAAAQNGWIDGDRVMSECLTSIKRAGADFILTYAGKRMAELLKQGKEF